MPAYSTWQPTKGKIQPVASAVQSATRRLVDFRGDLMRGNPIASTLLGVFGGPSGPFLEGAYRRRESIPGPARPSPPDVSVAGNCMQRRPGSSHCLDPAMRDLPDGPCGAVVGLFTWLWNRPNRPFQPNHSVQFQEKFPDNHPKHSDWAGSPACLPRSVKSVMILRSAEPKSRLSRFPVVRPVYLYHSS
jgi:hypothetical protein